MLMRNHVHLGDHGQDIRLALVFGVWNWPSLGFHHVSQVVLFGGFGREEGGGGGGLASCHLDLFRLSFSFPNVHQRLFQILAMFARTPEMRLFPRDPGLVWHCLLDHELIHHEPQWTPTPGLFLPIVMAS